MLGIQSKAGKVPETRFHTGSLRSTGEASLYFELNNPNDTKTFQEKDRVGDRVELGLNVTGGKRLTPRYCALISRALLKSMFECAWLDHGETLLEPRFDHVREAVLGEPREGFLLVGRTCDPDHSGTELIYNFDVDASGRDRIWVGAKYYGVFLGTDSRLPGPPVDLPDDHAILVTFGPADLRAAA
jgi:hypothetical protein